MADAESKPWPHVMWHGYSVMSGGFKIQSFKTDYPISDENLVTVLCKVYKTPMYKPTREEYEGTRQWNLGFGLGTDPYPCGTYDEKEASDIYDFPYDFPRNTYDTYTPDIPPEHKNYDSFKQALKDICCTDWYKMGPDGESYPKVLNGRQIDKDEDTWDLYFETNVRYLWDHKEDFCSRLIFLCIEYLCQFRCESPVQVLDLCKWIRTKSQESIVKSP